MIRGDEIPVWESLSYEEKNRVLYERQKHLLEEFLERNAIGKAQYEKFLHDLNEKMDGDSPERSILR